MKDASSRENAAYIAQMARELGRMANTEELSFIRYLLEMAYIAADDVVMEADDRAQPRQRRGE